MIFRKLFSSILLVLLVTLSFAQNHHTRFESIDVQHYKFEIHLNDSTNKIEGKTTVDIKLLKAVKSFTLDLIGIDSLSRGMTVESVFSENKSLLFSHKNNKLKIDLGQVVQPGELHEFKIKYSGIPANGLVISKNQYGDRTIFGDNWPDRARYWLPTVDHPSDKATIEFMVHAPKHYEVISNGYQVEEKELNDKLKFTHWKEDVPLPTKLMVIGVADFEEGNKDTCNGIPISSWVFPQNREKGFENYKYGTEALKYYSELIGPYSYEKLAHVQSKTRYGGMENAGCIFYAERTATSNRSQERLFAHEVAHQWFGNSVTEQNWHHVWLSEGFATYLTHVYNQHFYGEEVFHTGLKKDRERIIRYAKRNLAPIIDTTITDYTRLLNANSYQKASWFLHMLREDLGDDVFFKGLRKYYSDFQNHTALTKDFQQVMESVSGKNLDLFFNQWLRQPGHPVLSIGISTTLKKSTYPESSVTIIQRQEDCLFHFPLEIKFTYDDGTSEIKSLEVNKKENKISVVRKSKVVDINIDPNSKLLFECEGKKY
ncbi:MAG: M1 family metallopeptidase [Bacteroidota bacterium]